MILRSYLIVIFFVTIIKSFGQVNDSNIRLKVLQRNKIGKEFKFLNPKDSTITYLKYLGQVKTKNHKIYKVITSTWIWGLSHRATNRILIFDKNNIYLGNYYVTTTSDLPEEIKDNKLIFINSDSGCDKKVVTEVSFIDGIPKDFFRKCKSDSGDFYSFSKGE